MLPSAGELEQYDVVSFDVYDTLVVRPYVRPTDLFRHIERISGRAGFADLRIKAERDARTKHRREITLDEIYDQIPEFSDLKETEIDMEITVPRANHEVVNLFNELISAGKKVIIISDMYLPKWVISSVLNRCGITGYSGLYVSSEYGISKHIGDLYRKVLGDLGISPEKMFHIGDNRRSDHDIPKGIGISAYQYERPLDSYRRRNRDEYRFYKRKKSLERSILIGTDVMMSMNGHDDIWNEIGLRYGGPLSMSYVLKIISSGIEGKILFASRDGFNLKRIVNDLYPCFSTEYVYAQRLILDVLTDIEFPYGPVEVPNRMNDRMGYERTVAAMRRIIRFFSDELGTDAPKEKDETITFYLNNIDKIDSLRKSTLEEYTETMKRICGDGTVHLVDCTTMKFSSQRLVEHILGRKVKGHYFVTLGHDGDFDHDSMCDWHSPAIGWMNVDIPEFYLSSPEFPLVGWKDGPILGNDNEHERFRSEVYRNVSDGELEYARRYHDIFGRYGIPMDYWTVVGWSKLSAVRGTRYYEALSRIRWASDPDHTQYAPLITGVGSIKQIAKKLIVSVLDKMNGR